MLGWLTDPLASPIIVRALAEVLILSVACGPLGVWVLLYRDAYAAESISHGMLPGLVLAALAGIPLLFGALGGVGVAVQQHPDPERAAGERQDQQLHERPQHDRRGERVGQPAEHQCSWWPTLTAVRPPSRTTSSSP